MCLYKYPESQQYLIPASGFDWSGPTWNIGPHTGTCVIMVKRSHVVLAFVLLAILVIDGTLGEYHRSNKKHEKKSHKPYKNEKHSRKTREVRKGVEQPQKETLYEEEEPQSEDEEIRQHYRSKTNKGEKEINKHKEEVKKVKDGKKYKRATEMNGEMIKDKVGKNNEKRPMAESMPEEEQTTEEKHTKQKPAKVTQKKKYIIVEEVPFEDEIKQNKGKRSAEERRTVRYLVEEVQEEEQEEEQVEEYETTKCVRECGGEQSSMRRKVKGSVRKSCNVVEDEQQASREVSKRQPSSIMEQDTSDNTQNAEEEDEENATENEKCYYNK